MGESQQTKYTAFSGSTRIANGALKDVAIEVKKFVDQNAEASVLIFDDSTSELIDLDFRGSDEVFLRKLALFLPDEPISGEARRPGHPKLGVVAREVTLLPRHWEWLNSQPGGASVALRKLVEAAKRTNKGKDLVRQAQEATYRFMLAMAGDEEGFEEATRALFAGDQQSFHALISAWPIDVRNYIKKLAIFP